MQGRLNDAIQLAATGCKLVPDDEQNKEMLSQLKNYRAQTQSPKAPGQ